MSNTIKITGRTREGKTVEVTIDEEQIYVALAEINGLKHVADLDPVPVHNNVQSNVTCKLPLYMNRNVPLWDKGQVRERELGYVLDRLGFHPRELREGSPRKNYTYENVGNKFLADIINKLMDNEVNIHRVEDVPRGEVIAIQDDNRTFYINVQQGTAMYVDHGSDVIKVADISTMNLREDIRILAMARFNQKYLH